MFDSLRRKPAPADEPAPELDLGFLYVESDLAEQEYDPLRPGMVWDGPAAVADGLDVGHVRGIYALTDDGRDLRQPHLRLVAVDETPGESDDGNFHYEIAYPEDGMNKTCDGSRWPYKGQGVVLEPAPIVGKAGVE